MSQGKIGGLLLAAIAVVVVLGSYLAGFYNRVVKLDQSVSAAWAQVQTQYQRRFDLIPNLVESVKGIFDQEQEVFLGIADARTRYAGAATLDEQVAAAGEVESALARLLVVLENYPELRSSENVTRLMDELAGTENRVAVERRRFNESVQTFNVAIVTFPQNLLARLFGFEPKPFFEAAEGAETVPTVDFSE